MVTVNLEGGKCLQLCVIFSDILLTDHAKVPTLLMTRSVGAGKGWDGKCLSTICLVSRLSDRRESVRNEESQSHLGTYLRADFAPKYVFVFDSKGPSYLSLSRNLNRPRKVRDLIIPNRVYSGEI